MDFNYLNHFITVVVQFNNDWKIYSNTKCTSAYKKISIQIFFPLLVNKLGKSGINFKIKIYLIFFKITLITFLSLYIIFIPI